MYNRKAQKLGDVLKKFLRESGLDRKIAAAQVPLEWNNVIGEKIAGQTNVRRFEDGQLLVETHSAVWRTELLLRREEIMARINDRLGEPIVKEIIIR